MLQEVASGAIPAVIIRGVLTPRQAAAALAATPALVGTALGTTTTKQVKVLGAQMQDVLLAAGPSIIHITLSRVDPP